MTTQVASAPVTVPVATSYAKIGVGLSPNSHLLIVGLTGGKSPGLPRAASAQKSPYGSGNWTRLSKALTGTSSSTSMADLVIAADQYGTEALGLGNDGNIYRAGQEASGEWTAGAGIVSQTTTFVPGTLSTQALNTATVFAVANPLYAPWIALYRDQETHPQWQPGLALPNPTSSKFASLCARPDMSDAGTTHVIGLTRDGNACEVATTSGSGTGPTQTWTKGVGFLGDKSVLPALKQLVLVTADAAGNFHVIGLGTDNSVWDVDQFTANAATPAWSHTSACIVEAGQFTADKIDCYFSSAFTILLLASSGGLLFQLATYSNEWTANPSRIPSLGACADWHVAPNPTTGTGTEAFILGVASTGLVYEVADYGGGKWTQGPAGHISG